MEYTSIELPERTVAGMTLRTATTTPRGHRRPMAAVHGRGHGQKNVPGRLRTPTLRFALYYNYDLATNEYDLLIGETNESQKPARQVIWPLREGGDPRRRLRGERACRRPGWTSGPTKALASATVVHRRLRSVPARRRRQAAPTSIFVALA